MNLIWNGLWNQLCSVMVSEMKPRTSPKAILNPVSTFIRIELLNWTIAFRSVFFLDLSLVIYGHSNLIDM